MILLISEVLGMHYTPRGKWPQGKRRSPSPLGLPDLLLLRRRQHGADDLVISGAAAQVAGEEVAGFVLGRVGVLVQERLGSDDEARGADAALQGRPLEEALLQRVQGLGCGDALNGGDGTALHLGRHYQAGVDEPAIKNDVARAAVAVVAAFLGTGQTQLVAQDFQEALPRLTQKLGVLAVDFGLNVNLLAHHLISLLDCDNAFHVEQPVFAGVGGDAEVAAAKDVHHGRDLPLDWLRIIVEEIHGHLAAAKCGLEGTDVRGRGR